MNAAVKSDLLAHVRSLLLARRRSHSTRVSLLDLCDDTLGLVALSVQEEQRDGTRRAHLAHLTELTSCALVCTRLHDALKVELRGVVLDVTLDDLRRLVGSASDSGQLSG